MEVSQDSMQGGERGLKGRGSELLFSAVFNPSSFTCWTSERFTTVNFLGAFLSKHRFKAQGNEAMLLIIWNMLIIRDKNEPGY